MGIPNKARGMRLSDDEVGWIDEVIEVVDMLGSRTAAVGWGMRRIRTILKNATILRGVEKLFQDEGMSFFVSQPYDTSSSLGEAKPGPQKLDSIKGGSERRLRVNSSYFTATVSVANSHLLGPSRITPFVLQGTPRISLRLGSYSSAERVA